MSIIAGKGTLKKQIIFIALTEFIRNLRDAAKHNMMYGVLEYGPLLTVTESHAARRGGNKRAPYSGTAAFH